MTRVMSNLDAESACAGLTDRTTGRAANGRLALTEPPDQAGPFRPSGLHPLHDQETRTRLISLTNQITWPARTIAALDKSRQPVKPFFILMLARPQRRIKRLSGASKNAMKTRTLIAASASEAVVSLRPGPPLSR